MKWLKFLQAHQQPPIHLIIAVSSGGKSTYISSATNYLQQGLPVYLGNDLERGDVEDLLSDECVVHYNLFRVYDNRASNLGRSLTDEAVLKMLLSRKRRLRVTVLVASRDNVARRMLLRETGEKLLRGHTAEFYQYPRFELLELLYRVNLEDLFAQLLGLFRSENIPVCCLDANSSTYRALESDKEINAALREPSEQDYTVAQMRSVLEEGRFEYQSIGIAPELRTTGHDRSSTFEIIREQLDLSGRSLLDVGCAYGYFCYKALDSGAARVTGTELKSHRFVGANIIRDFMSRDCEILYRDIFEPDFEDTYDVILLLNVIHHLQEPIYALNKLARLCREALVIEFPTLSDNKFRETLEPATAQSHDQPFIGVSLLEEQDQYYVFSPAAIRRILIENATSPFESIEFLPSPMSDERIIAICRKQERFLPASSD